MQPEIRPDIRGLVVRNPAPGWARATFDRLLPGDHARTDDAPTTSATTPVPVTPQPAAGPATPAVFSDVPDTSVPMSDPGDDGFADAPLPLRQLFDQGLLARDHVVALAAIAGERS